MTLQLGDVAPDFHAVPALGDAEGRKRFPKGWRTIKPYMRMVPDPVHRR